MTVDVLVVGGGMAGLSAAAFCGQAGKSVRLCEMGNTLGGLVGSFTRNGFVFDAGIRAIEDSGIMLPMLKSLGIEIPFVKSPVSLGIADRMVPVETAQDLVAYGDMLKGLYPDNHADVDAILDDIRLVMRHMEVLYGIENPIFKDLLHDQEYVMKVLMPWMGRFLFTIGKINRMQEPAEDHLRRFTPNQSLIDIISQHYFRKTPAFFAMSYFSLYLDYRYPKGGTGTLPAALSAYCTEKGVHISTGTTIVQLQPEQHLAVTQSGERIAYRTLIWAADQKALYRTVQLDAIRNGTLRESVMGRQAMLEPLKGNDSLFSLYLAVDRDPNAFKAISNGHLFYTPSPEGLGGLFHADLDALLEEEKQVRAGTLPSTTYHDHIGQWLDRYLTGTTYEISIPVLRDPALAPEGKTGLIVSTLMDHTLFRIIRDMGWYEEMKARCETRMLQSLSESIYPGLDQVVLEAFSYSPLSLERQTGNTGGAITGWAFTNPVIPAVATMQKVATSVNTPLPDVYQAGQWAYSPAGLPISVLTGKLAAEKVKKRLKKGK